MSSQSNYQISDLTVLFFGPKYASMMTQRQRACPRLGLHMYSSYRWFYFMTLDESALRKPSRPVYLLQREGPELPDRTQLYPSVSGIQVKISQLTCVPDLTQSELKLFLCMRFFTDVTRELSIISVVMSSLVSQSLALE